ncbi:MAG: hypothetical protein PHI12_08305 [Dehalococcoidales bacterium]|nr:hypothetical protein [Dehalococcoidales bacterium]
MRKTTRRKYWGRSAIAGSLRTALNELNEAIAIASKPPAESPLATSIQKVLEDVSRALEAEKLYILGRKKISDRLVEEKRSLEELLQEVIDVPVLPDEKVVAKQERKKKKAIAK